MKKITIQKKDLKNKNYDESILQIEIDAEEVNNMDKEIANFLHSCFELLNYKQRKVRKTEDVLGFVTLKPNKEGIAITLKITLDEIVLMKQEITRLFIAELKNVNFNYFSVNKIILLIEQDEKIKEGTDVEKECSVLL